MLSENSIFDSSRVNIKPDPAKRTPTAENTGSEMENKTTAVDASSSKTKNATVIVKQNGEKMLLKKVKLKPSGLGKTKLATKRKSATSELLNTELRVCAKCSCLIMSDTAKKHRCINTGDNDPSKNVLPTDFIDIKPTVFPCMCCNQLFTKETIVSHHCKPFKAKVPILDDRLLAQFLHEPQVIIRSNKPEGESTEPEDIKPSICYKCLLPFTKESLLTHQCITAASSQTSKSEIQCEWCPKSFDTMSKAIAHKHKSHRYEATNYHCTFCGSLFPMNVTLQQHIATEHKDVKQPSAISANANFRCNLCGAAFSSLAAQTIHEQMAHRLEQRARANPFIPPPSRKLRYNQADEILSVYYCHLCGAEYIMKYNLLKHLETVHSFEERCQQPPELIRCPRCDAVFFTANAFNVHMTYHTPEDVYATSERQRLQVVARVDQDFDYRRIPTPDVKALMYRGKRPRASKGNVPSEVPKAE